MTKAASPPGGLRSVDWLHDIHEVLYPLGGLHPLWLRYGRVENGPPLPCPTVPHPERHPYCELHLLVAGRVTQFVGGEQQERHGGDLSLIGPGVPHYAMLRRYPWEFITVYFLPGLLVELAPESDGPQLLRRFTARQSLKERMVRPPVRLRGQIEHALRQMIRDFEHPVFGSEARQRMALLDILVGLVGWERQAGRAIEADVATVNWKPLESSLNFIREHYAEPIYAQDLMRAAGLTKPRLQQLFRDALGVPWVQYLQTYRIHQAVSRLNDTDDNVTSAALAAGFSTLSHFNEAFHKHMGLAPTQYLKKLHARRTGRPQRSDHGVQKGKN